MIIVNLKGGLGNQMFQYAMGRSLSITTKKDFKLDKTNYDTDTFRSYGLNVFNIQENIANKKEIEEIKPKENKRFLIKKIRNLIEFRILKNYHISWEPFFIRGILYKLKKGRNVYIDGYWQSYKYFNDIRDIISKDFTLKIPLERTHPELLKEIVNNESVSMAIRRSDYLTPGSLKSFGVCSATYYKKSIELIEKKIVNPFFFVVTDDLDWVIKNINFKGHKVKFVSLLRKDNLITDYQELIIMSKCKHNIIANSSFSWWSAWLNDNPNKIIVAPNIWFTDNSIKTKDILPKRWVALPRD